MSKITVKLADGSQVEVDKPDGVFTSEEVARDYRPKAEIEGMVNRLVAKRTEEAVAKARNEILEDPETRLRILQSESIPLDADGNVNMPEGGITQEDLKKRMDENSAFLRTQWEKDHLAQIDAKDKELEKAMSGLESMRLTVLRNEIAEGARLAGVSEDKFKPVPGLGPYSAPVYAVEKLFKWDETSGMHALQGESGPKFNPNGTEMRPNIGALEYWKEVAAKDQAYQEGGWFPDRRPSGGPDIGNAGSGGAFNPATASDSELAEYAKQF